MILDDITARFVDENEGEDVCKLALKVHQNSLIDGKMALQQIAGRQIAKMKIPTWYQKKGVIYPMHLSMEQCSSEQTALFKKEVMHQKMNAFSSIADLTGGLGVDLSFMSQGCTEIYYVEQNEPLCELAAHNLPLFCDGNIYIHHTDSASFLYDLKQTLDWIYVDPARRNLHGGKVVSISDCTPDIGILEEQLVTKAHYVMVKLSPMLEIANALQQLNHVSEVYVVSVNNECKELLLLLQKEATSSEDTPIHCVNLTACTTQINTSTRRMERNERCQYASQISSYLYEPNTSLLKAGVLNSLTEVFPVKKLHYNSHLYTSDCEINTFPGRRFQVVGCFGFSKKELKELQNKVPKANLTIRNFPSSVPELRKRLKLQEGGDDYLFATTMMDDNRIVIWCKPLKS